MVIVEGSSVMSLVCWNLKVFLQCVNLLMVC